MPSGKAVEFKVIVDNAVLPEYKLKDQVYTEVDLHGPGSYQLEEDKQKYPVVPFVININKLVDHPLWISVYLDGQLVCSRPLCGKKIKINGIKVGSEIHELLFSLPRITEPLDTQKRSGDREFAEYVGTIYVVCSHANCIGQTNLPVYHYQEGPPQAGGSHSTKLRHLTKKEVSASRSELGVIVGREGRPKAQLMRTQNFRSAPKYVPSQDILEEVVLRFRPRVYATEPLAAATPKSPIQTPAKPLVAALKHSPRMPLEDVANRVNGAASNQTEPKKEMPTPLLCPSQIKRRESVAPPHIEEEDEIEKDEELANQIQLRNIKKRASEHFANIRVKTENLDESFIIIDDEEDFIFDEDDSVIYMGDDDCHIMDISNNVSIIDLDDSMCSEADISQLSLNAHESELDVE